MKFKWKNLKPNARKAGKKFVETMDNHKVTPVNNGASPHEFHFEIVITNNSLAQLGITAFALSNRMKIWFDRETGFGHLKALTHKQKKKDKVDNLLKPNIEVTIPFPLKDGVRVSWEEEGRIMWVDKQVTDE